MEEKNVTDFKRECELYLSSLGISVLRILGRKLHLQTPTACKKEQLIGEIIAVLCGEITPTRTNRGAPIKFDYLPIFVMDKIEELREKYLYSKEVLLFEEAKTPNMDLSKLEQLGAIQNVDDEGRVWINKEFRNRLELALGDLVEEKIYKDEKGENILVIRKI